MKIEKLMIISLIIGFLMIVTGIILLIIDTIEESRCMELTPYEFYNNKYCVERWNSSYENKKEN